MPGRARKALSVLRQRQVLQAEDRDASRGVHGEARCNGFLYRHAVLFIRLVRIPVRLLVIDDVSLDAGDRPEMRTGQQRDRRVLDLDRIPDLRLYVL